MRFCCVYLYKATYYVELDIEHLKYWDKKLGDFQTK